MVTVFSMVACDFSDDSDDSSYSLSGTVTAKSGNGYYVEFHYQHANTNDPTCEFTTDLPAPNDKFILGEKGTIEESKSIMGLTSGQVVKWKATLSRNSGRLEKQGTQDGIVRLLYRK